jgi:hypothetical protein
MACVGHAAGHNLETIYKFLSSSGAKTTGVIECFALESSLFSATRTELWQCCHMSQWLRRGFGLVNRFIGSSLVVTTISSYTLQITATIAHEVFNAYENCIVESSQLLSVTASGPWLMASQLWLTEKFRHGPHSKQLLLQMCLQFCCLALGMARTTMKTIILLSELLRNIATDCLPRICLRGKLFASPLPSSGCTCNNILEN